MSNHDQLEPKFNKEGSKSSIERQEEVGEQQSKAASSGNERLIGLICFFVGMVMLLSGGSVFPMLLGIVLMMLGLPLMIFGRWAGFWQW